MLDFLYHTDKMCKAFGLDHSVAPAILEHSKKTLVAIYPKTGEDGQPCEVYCTAMPATFFSIKVAESPNSVGEIRPAYEITTGSSMQEWVIQTAQHIAEGMLGVKSC